MSKNKKLEVLVKNKDIKTKIKKYSKNIIKDLMNYEKDSFVFVNLLNGSSPFFVDIIRTINKLGYNKKIITEYISASSYQDDKSCELKIKKWIKNIENKIIYLFEDIIDSGQTLTKIIKKIKESKPKDIKVLTLVDKNTVHGQLDFEYETLFEIEDVFLVGYGLDYNEKFRQLKDICKYKN